MNHHHHWNFFLKLLQLFSAHPMAHARFSPHLAVYRAMCWTQNWCLGFWFAHPLQWNQPTTFLICRNKKKPHQWRRQLFPYFCCEDNHIPNDFYCFVFLDGWIIIMADQQPISHEVTTIKMMASLDSYIHQQHHHHHLSSLLEMSEVANFELGGCLTNYKPWVFKVLKTFGRILQFLMKD